MYIQKCLFLLLLGNVMTGVHVRQIPRNRKSYRRSGSGFEHMDRFRPTVTRTTTRTIPTFRSLDEDCDYIVYYCLESYKTGKICGRTNAYKYANFKNYCMLDYVNCVEKYNVWNPIHMGECFNLTEVEKHIYYEYMDDAFLDQQYQMIE